jgi:osmotically-inducible protein OsmY
MKFSSMSQRARSRGRTAAVVMILAATLGGALGGCAALLVGGAVGGVLVYQDRRTSGTVVDDEGLEAKSATRIRDTIGDRGHINVTSYNRVLLVTGEVPTEADKAAVGAALERMENVKGVLNELAVGPNSSLGDRSNDALITSKVKASLVDARDIFANAYKVVTERGVVYLMGIVTEREAERGAQIARGVSGVKKVVTAFDIISEAELARLQPARAPAPAPAPVAPASAATPEPVR